MAEFERRLQSYDAEIAKQARLDLYLAERQALWSIMPLETYVETKLADALVTAERQFNRFEALKNR